MSRHCNHGSAWPSPRDSGGPGRERGPEPARSREPTSSVSSTSPGRSSSRGPSPRPTGPALCFGRTSKGAARLSESFRGGAAEKTYVAVTSRPLRESEGVIQHWLLKDTSRNSVRVVEPDTPGAKRAETRFQRLESRGGESLVRLSPITGRSHQLRVAMASLGAPLKGDLRYGATSPLPDRSVALHALSLEVPHPTRPEPVALRAAPPSLEVWSGWREL